jgi:hypothetical protein
MTNSIGGSGILAISLPGRETGIIGEGVVQNTDGTYSPNTQLQLLLKTGIIQPASVRNIRLHLMLLM